MRFSSMTALVAAIASPILSVAATGSIGYCLGANTPSGGCKTASDYEADLTALSGHTTIVRIYSASDCNSAEVLLPVAKAKGFQVILGVW
jgi:glucan 1,3-beta-glucosidase